MNLKVKMKTTRCLFVFVFNFKDNYNITSLPLRTNNIYLTSSHKVSLFIFWSSLSVNQMMSVSGEPAHCQVTDDHANKNSNATCKFILTTFLFCIYNDNTVL